MSGRMAGFEIGGYALHISVPERGGAFMMHSAKLPEGSVRDGRIVSYDATGDFIRQTCRRLKIRADSTAAVLPPGLCCCRRLSVPLMTHRQLKVNLPYELRDFVLGRKEDYLYDYSVLDVIQGASGEPAGLDIFAAAAPKTALAAYRSMFRRAGMRLRKAVPAQTALSDLLRRSGNSDRCCILDVGHTASRLFIYSGDKIMSSHIIDIGCSALDQAVSSALGLDGFAAQTFRESDRDGCQRLDGCMAVYRELAAQVQRAIYFFGYKNSGETPGQIHLIGGGAGIIPLREALEKTLPIPLRDASELIPGFEGSCAGIYAAGAALQ